MPNGHPVGKILASIDVESHSNDITYIPKDGTVIHPDHQNEKIDIYKLNKGKGKDEYSFEKVGEIKGKNGNIITYDKERDNIVLIEKSDGEVYKREDLLKGGDPVAQFKVPEKVKDQDNSIYYNYRGGGTSYDGTLYVTYSGFPTDKEGYSYAKGDRTIGNLTVAIDYENGGTPIGQIKDDVPQEVESIDNDEDGQLVYYYNYGHKTRIFKTNTDQTNVKKISNDYKKGQTK